MVLSVSKERAALNCKKSPVACKARVKPVKHGPILAWYLCLFVQQWSWRGRCKENYGSPWQPSITILYRPPLRSES